MLLRIMVVGRYINKLLLITSGFLAGAVPVFSADILKELGKPVPTCYTTTYNAIRLLPKLFETGKVKELDQMVRQWDKYCDPAKFEPLLRARLLTDLVAAREPAVHQSETEAFLRYQNWKSRLDSSESLDPIYRDYYDFTVRFARGRIAAASIQLHPLWHYYAEDYEKFHAEVRRNPVSSVARAIETKREALRSKAVLPVGIYGGVWQPVGANSLLGTHPLVGVFIGWGNYRWEIVANIHFKFLDSANDVTTIYKNQPVTSRHFFGGYIGLDITYNWITALRYDIGTTFGVAYDGFDIVKSSSYSANDGKGIGGLNLNAGVKFRYYLSIERSDYFFISGHMNFLNYENAGGTDLSGGALTFFAGYGAAFSIPRAKAIRDIGGI